MAYTVPPKDDRPSSHSSPNSSNRSSFAEQAIQPCFSGRIELEWENDRVRIRAEILEKEKARFRVLEEEIRMQLKLDREAAIQRWEASTKRVDPLRTCRPLIGQCEERVVPSRTVVSVDSPSSGTTPRYPLRMGYDAPSETCQPTVQYEERRLQLPPMVVGVGGYQHPLMPVVTSGLGPSDQIKPLSEPPKETIMPAKCEANVFGLNRKRKASTVKGWNWEKIPKGWTCELCKISIYNWEKSIDEHLKGKKHKRKELAMALSLTK